MINGLHQMKLQIKEKQKIKSPFQQLYKMKLLTVILLLGLGIPIAPHAQPNLSSRKIINGMAIYNDLKKQGTFYYTPLELELDTNSEGKPNFSFVRMTHIGNRARGMETWKQNSMIQFSIKSKGIRAQQLTPLKNKLQEDVCNRCKIRLRPMPIKKMEATLVYADLETKEGETLNSTYYKNDDTQNAGSGIWSVKTFTIRPNEHTSQILWNGFKNNKGLLSVAYGIWGKGKNTDSITYHFNGPKELEEVFKNLNDKDIDSTRQKPSYVLISAGAFSVDVNIKKWPDLLREIDFESTLSPRYGLLDVYCHDFIDGIRPDLVAKIVEFEAEGVANKKVKTEVDFLKDTPDIHAHALKFEYAVRLDKPLRYRVIELTEMGEVLTGDWQQKENWTGIIDVSSKKNFEETIKTKEK